MYPGDFPDPAVILVDGTYHAFATQDGAVNLQRLTSTDLVHWTRPTPADALRSLPSWADSLGTWAPEPARVGGRFVLYYTVHQRGGAECISTATATGIADQFVDSSSAPMVCQAAGGGSIDPSPYTDTTTGTRYLAWKTNDAGAATLFSRRLTDDGLGFAATAPAVPLLRSTGISWNLGNVEGPSLVDTGRGWLLFYSGNVYTSAAYGIGYATCDGPQGPCTNTSTTTPWVGSHGRAQGPGGQSLVVDAAGRLVMVYHAWDGVVGYANGGVRALWADVLDVSSGAPVFVP
ncbi:glycoside hydrolase family 43 protein [Rhodococcus aerolatus]